MAGQTPHAQDSLRWIADYLVKSHHSDWAYTAQVGEVLADHSYWGRPEDMSMDRPSWDITPSAPGECSPIAV